MRVFIRMSCCSVAQSRLSLCDPMDCSTPGFPVLHHLPELAQTHVHWVGDAIQPSHPLLSPSPAFNLSQHQDLFWWVGSLHQVAKVLELQHQSFQWISSVQLLSRVWLFATPWTAACQASLSMGFSRQEYWSGVPLPSPFEELSSLILYNDNKPFSDWIAVCDKMWVLYNQRWSAQWLDQEEAPKHFPKPNLH